MEDSLQGIREGEGEEGEEDEDSLPLQGARGGGDTVVTVDTVVKFQVLGGICVTMCHSGFIRRPCL